MRAHELDDPQRLGRGVEHAGAVVRSVNILRGTDTRTAVLRSIDQPGIIGGVAQVGRDLYNRPITPGTLQAGDVLPVAGPAPAEVGGDFLHALARRPGEVFLAGQFQFADDRWRRCSTSRGLNDGGPRPRLALPTSANGPGADLLQPAGTITSLQSYNFGLRWCTARLRRSDDRHTFTQVAGFAQDEVRLGQRARSTPGSLRHRLARPSVNVASTSAPFRSQVRDYRRNNLAPRLGSPMPWAARTRRFCAAARGCSTRTPCRCRASRLACCPGRSRRCLPLTGIGVNGTSADVAAIPPRRTRRSNTLASGHLPRHDAGGAARRQDGTPNPVQPQASAGIEHAFASDWSMAPSIPTTREPYPSQPRHATCAASAQRIRLPGRSGSAAQRARGHRPLQKVPG